LDSHIVGFSRARRGAVGSEVRGVDLPTLELAAEVHVHRLPFGEHVERRRAGLAMAVADRFRAGAGRFLEDANEVVGIRGFRFSNVCPETDGTQPPSIKLWYVVTFCVLVGMALRVPYSGHRLQLREKRCEHMGLRRHPTRNLLWPAAETIPG